MGNNLSNADLISKELLELRDKWKYGEDIDSALFKMDLDLWMGLIELEKLRALNDIRDSLRVLCSKTGGV
jgi:hypothetical protein